MALSEHLLTVSVPKRAQLVHSARAEGSKLEIFFPCRQNLPIGRQVKVTVTFEDAAETFLVSGRVAFVRSAAQGEQGVGISFDAVGKVQATELLAYCNNAETANLSGPSKRVYTKLRCKVTIMGQAHAGEVLDLSSTGVFVSAPKAPRLKPGSKIEMRFKAGLLTWGPPFEVQIMWNGEKRGQSGFGARFVGDIATATQEANKYLSGGK
jgi:Tfp pilus assembly protein PilZ